MRTRDRAGYGAADAGIAASECMLQIYLLYFATEAMGLPAIWAGAAIGIGILWDAISDPLMGWVLDRAHPRARWYPFSLAAGAFGLSIALIALFNPWTGLSLGASFLWLLAAYLLVNTGMTVIAVPHLALASIVSQDTHERTALFGWRLLFGNVGLLAGLLLPPTLAGLVGLDFNQSEGRAYGIGMTTWVVGVTLLLGSFTCIMAIRPHLNRRPAAAPERWISSVREALMDRLFRPLLLAFLIASASRAVNGAIAFYYYEFRLQIPLQSVITAVLLPFIAAIVLSIPGWIFLSRRFGKKVPALVALLSLGLLGSIAYPIFPAGSLLGPVVMALVGGFAVGAIILFESLVSDVVCLRRDSRGHNCESLYFGLWKMSSKLARALAIVLTALALHLIGFESGSPSQSQPTSFKLSLLFGPGVGLGFILSALFLLRFPSRGATMAGAEARSQKAP